MNTDMSVFMVHMVSVHGPHGQCSWSTWSVFMVHMVSVHGHDDMTMVIMI